MSTAEEKWQACSSTLAAAVRAWRKRERARELHATATTTLAAAENTEIDERMYVGLHTAVSRDRRSNAEFSVVGQNVNSVGSGEPRRTLQWCVRARQPLGVRACMCALLCFGPRRAHVCVLENAVDVLRCKCASAPHTERRIR